MNSCRRPLGGDWTRPRRVLVVGLAALLFSLHAPEALASHPPDHHGHSPSAAPAQDISATPSGNGYWVLDEAGGVFTFGDAAYHGSIPGLRARGQRIGQANVMSLVPTRSGDGYYLLDEAGGVFTFGDAVYHGSIPGLRARGQRIGQANVMSLVLTRSGDGYYLLDEAGGVFTFGDAVYHGSIPGLRQQGRQIGRTDAVDLAPTGTGNGYRVMDSAGGIFTFGDAAYHGSLPGRGVRAHAMEMESFSDDGYWILTDDGAVHAFGSAGTYGSALGRTGGQRSVGLAASPHGTGYWIVTSNGRVISYPGGIGEIDVAEYLFDHLNDERRARGLPELEWDPRLAARAEQWGREMVARDHIEHSPDDPDWYGDIAPMVAENLARSSYGWAGGIHVFLMKSDSHRDLRLDPGAYAVGLGAVCAGGDLWIVEALAGDGGTPPASSSEPRVHDELTGTRC